MNSESQPDRRVRFTQARKIYRHRGYLPFLFGRRPPIAYVGWSGNHNLGDDALLEAHEHLLPEVRLVGAPNLPASSVLRALAGVRGGSPFGAICLGGGTLIGNGHFRRTLDGLRSVQPGAEMFMLSCGVEDPSFLEGNRCNVREELAQWADVLRDFPTIRVRGPRSAATLGELGFDAEIVGDPALVLGDSDPGPRPPERTIGINVGVTDDLWGGDNQSVIQGVTEFASAASDAGWQVLVLPVSSEDLAACRTVAEVAGPGVHLIEDALKLEVFFHHARQCRVVVAEKLHAAVLAAAVFVPTVTLEYRPKCVDFQASVDRQQWNLRTDEIDVDRLLEMVREVDDDHGEHVRQLARSVSDLRSRLHEAAAAISCRLDGLEEAR